MDTYFKRALLAVFALFFFASSSFATDGYFETGYGIKQEGQGGACVAFPVDSLAGTTNPAGLVDVGDRFDFGLTLFRPFRDASITGNEFADGVYDANRVKNFFIPELGYSHLVRPNVALGVSIYGNGGMNTSYTSPIPLLGDTRGGVDLEQIFISPAVAFKVNDHNSFGVALNIAYQRFSAEGLQNFASAEFSSDPSRVTNNGYSNFFGAGVRLGWLGKLNDIVSVGGDLARAEREQTDMAVWISGTWPWYVAGSLIGLFVPALLIAGNKVFGVSSNLRHLCSAVVPGKLEYFRYDWKKSGLWNLTFLTGIVIGGFLAAHWGAPHDIAISAQTKASLAKLGLNDFSGVAPHELFSWHALFTLRGFVSVVVGGFLVGFGTAYAGGCTSGHAISGLADFQLPSLIAVFGFFAGGLAATYLILPYVL